MGGQPAVEVELFVSGSTNAHSTNTNNCDHSSFIHMPLFSYAELCRNDPQKYLTLENPLKIAKFKNWGVEHHRFVGFGLFSFQSKSFTLIIDTQTHLVSCTVKTQKL